MLSDLFVNIVGPITEKRYPAVRKAAGKCRPSCRLLSATLVCFALASCKNEVAWREQVRLGAGDVITIEREVLLEGGGAAWPRGQGGIPRQHIIRFKPTPGSDAETEWRSSKRDTSTYAELPVVLDVTENRSWFIFTALSLNASCVQYLKYELRDGAWQEVRLDNQISTHQSNLTLRAGSVEIDPMVSINTKAEEHRNHRIRATKKRVGPSRFGCDILYRGPYPPEGAH